jgi:predicted DNA-binding transcriptional regulator AlpA
MAARTNLQIVVSPEPGQSPREFVYVTFPDLPKYAGAEIERRQLRRMIKRGEYPPAYQIAPNKIAWKSWELLEWRDNRPVALGGARGRNLNYTNR